MAAARPCTVYVTEEYGYFSPEQLAHIQAVFIALLLFAVIWFIALVVLDIREQMK